MKQGSVDADRLKSESRHCFQRRKMSKNSPILNGDAENMDRTLVRELNFAVAAAFHDHLSCTKSAQDFCSRDRDTVPKEVRINNNLPCETDHIYANCSETRNKTNVANSPSSPTELESNEVSGIIISRSELIGHLRKQLAIKNQKRLRTHLDRKHRERRMCYLRKRYQRSSLEATGNLSVNQSMDLDINCTAPATPTGSQHTSVSTPILATRYFGRRSKTVPSRALKRRYLGPPKALPVQRLPNMSPATFPERSLESDASHQDIVKNSCETNDSISTFPKIHKKRGRKPKKLTVDHLTTDTAYFLPDNQVLLHPYTAPQIDVPLWKHKPVTSFYQMEGTENINDPVFHRRHAKCELNERRRKRWDIQRLREQKASQKLKYKYSREANSEGNQKSHSFCPDPRHIEYIEVTDVLPVLAFGHVIPLFQPCEFSLPWPCDQNQSFSTSAWNSSSRNKKGRPSTQSPKVT